MSHGRTVCTHGALITQCRCMDHKTTTVVPCPWPEVHADYPTLTTAPKAATPYPVRDLTGQPDEAFTAELARWEAADEAEESLRERLADTFDVVLDSLGLSGEMSSRAADHLADAALDVMKPQP